MKKKYLWLTLVLMTVGFTTSAQAPLTINYQAVVRDGQTGLPLANEEVYLSIELASGSGGSLVFKEDHPVVQTNEFGLLNLRIGTGESIIGSLAEVPWETGNIWIAVSIDAGNGLEILQESKFTSVPYALFAQDVANKDDADADPENELIDDFTFDQATNDLHLTESGELRTVHLGSLVNDDDSDPTNEYVDNLEFDSDSRTLILTESDNVLSVNLGSIDDADADPANEFVDSLKFNAGTGILELFQNNGQMLTANLMEFGDGDASNTNELITDVTFDSESNILHITDNGQTWSIPLGDLVNDADSDPENELIESFTYDPDAMAFTIREAGQDHVLDVSGISDDQDGDPENELITNVSFDSDSHSLVITDNGQEWTIPLGSLIDDADSDPTNEAVSEFSFNPVTKILNLEESGDTFDVDLSSLQEDDDADDTNELISDFDFDPATHVLNITEAGNSRTVDLSVFSTDTDAENELVTDFDFDTATNLLTLDQPGLSDFSIDLSSLDDPDQSVTNELVTGLAFNNASRIFTLQQPGGNKTVSLGPDNVNDADFDPSNEFVENLSFNNTTNRLSLSQNGAVAFDVDLSGLDDDDGDTTNELINDFRYEAGTGQLIISEAGVDHAIDFSLFAADTDPGNELVQGLTFNNGTRILSLQQAGGSETVNLGQDSVNDADADPSNEFQDLTLTGNNLSLTSSSTNINLSAYDNSSLAQGKIFIGNGSNKAAAQTVSQDLSLAQNGTATVTGIQSHAISADAPSDGDVLVYNATTSQWEPESSASVGPASDIRYYSVDPSDFVTPSLRVDGDAADPDWDEINPLGYEANDSGDVLYSADGGIEIIAPIHLPHGAEIIEAKIYVRDKALGDILIKVIRNNITEFSDDPDDIMIGGTSLLSSWDEEITLAPFGSPDKAIVDNQYYSYRLWIDFTVDTPGSDVKQGFYGAVIKYQLN